MRLLDVADLFVNQSAMTGEAMPVETLTRVKSLASRS
ncbi:hypothetical protein [Rhizobium sp. LjRoot258]